MVLAAPEFASTVDPSVIPGWVYIGWNTAYLVHRGHAGPRGGVPVAFEVARVLDAPLDVIVVRKLGLPYQPELAMGAIATGATAKAACQVARAHGAAKVVLAVPVAPPSAVRELRTVADEVVCLVAPRRFMAVGEWYAHFGQTSDAEVVALLERASERTGAGRPS